MGREKPKQFLHLKGKPVLGHVLEKFLALSDLFSEIVVVIPPGSREYCREILLDLELDVSTVLFIEGGEERQDSVHEGLKHISESKRVISIHDGVRPLVSSSLVEKIAREAEKYKAVIPVMPLKETLKEVNGNGKVIKTVPRENFRAVQTPQGFHRETILKAYEWAKENNFSFTDDAALVEGMGEQVYTVPGEVKNLKITTPEDLLWAEFLLSQEDGNV